VGLEADIGEFGVSVNKDVGNGSQVHSVVIVREVRAIDIHLDAQVRLC